jgi:hypothetical protein
VDVDEPPWFVEGDDVFFVSEKGAVGTEVGRLSAADEDFDTTLTYSISGCTGSADHSQNGADGTACTVFLFYSRFRLCIVVDHHLAPPSSDTGTTCWFTIDAEGTLDCDLNGGTCGGIIRLNSERPPQGEYEITAIVTDETGLVAQHTQAIVVVVENYAPVYTGDLVATVKEDIAPLGVICQVSGFDDDDDDIFFEPVSVSYLPTGALEQITITYNRNAPEAFPFTLQSTSITTAELKLNYDKELNFEEVSSITNYHTITSSPSHHHYHNVIIKHHHVITRWNHTP